MKQLTRRLPDGTTLRRWAITGTRRIVWAPTKTAAATDAGVPVSQIEPAGRDWRTRQRGGLKRAHIGLRVTAAQAARIRANARERGLTLTAFVLSRCL